MSAKYLTTNDAIIRTALADELDTAHKKDERVRIIHEFQVSNGDARIDIAVFNGVMHGYEIKSDRDTLLRLSEQVRAYSDVFDKVTIVVGKKHLYDVLHIVPDWWGVRIAKHSDRKNVCLLTIREESENPNRDNLAIAQLLWRHEALSILEEEDYARGVRSKPKAHVYARLANLFSQEELSQKVRETIFFRDWRPDSPLLLRGV